MKDKEEVELPARAGVSLIEGGIAAVRKVVEEERELVEKEREFVAELRRREKISIASNECCECVCAKTERRRPRTARTCRAASAPPHFAPEPPRPPNLHAPVLSFSARLLTYVNEKCEGNGAVAYKRAGVKKQIYSRIISSDTAQASKQTVMQFCIGLKLTMVEADRLMRSAGYAFSGSIPLDRAFTYCIENDIYNIRDVEEILVANQLPSLKLKF